ncbi:hypothetical protein HMN09_00574800 [Mycena chlorophos]|uniref:Uncharacterized protein n=1 Tax=Mycena chlorophos TaxID=658473 RepID=A0A8H6TE74_MYCCL|nr:hypothetical protein HMN09_00574800 [Mycena chlorophos]
MSPSRSHSARRPTRLALLSALLSSPLRLCQAIPLTNLTIDDTNTSFFTFGGVNGTNSPPEWAAITPSTPCDYCSAQPPTTDIYNKTWHDGSVGSRGSFTFNGTEIWIYGVDIENSANITFTLADINLTTYHSYDAGAQFVFNALFFHAADLPTEADGTPRSHTVDWVLGESSKNGTSALFDYAVITVEREAATPSPSPSSSHSHHSNAGAIAGGVVGGLAALGILLFALFCLRMRRRNRNQHPGLDDKEVQPEPFTQQHPPVRGPGTDAASIAPTMATSGSASLQPLRLETQSVMTGTGTGTSVSGSGGRSAGVGHPPGLGSSSGKTLDTSWTNPAPLSSVTSPLSSSDARSASDPDRTTLAPSARETFLEERLAALEAHVREMSETPSGIGMAVPPPAYEGREP